MAREFSLAHLTLLSCAPPELIEVAARARYQYVSLRAIPVTATEPRYALAEDKELFRKTKNKLRDTKIRLLDIELARIVPGLNIKCYEPAFAAAAELGGRFVLSSGWSPERDFTVEKFRDLCDLARPYGLTVCLEFVTFANIATLAQAADVVRSAERENGAICIDTLHFFRSHCVPSELEGMSTSWFPYMQLSDAPVDAPATREGLIFAARADRQFVGEGGLPIVEVLNRLPEVPYAIEAPNTELSLQISPVDFARRALAAANAYLDAHPRYGIYHGEQPFTSQVGVRSRIMSPARAVRIGGVLAEQNKSAIGREIRRNSAATRDNILVAATEEFALYGLSGARVDRIAQKMSATKRMIYYYFKSKEALYQAVLESSYRNIRNCDSGTDLEALAPDKAICKMIEATMEYELSHPEFIRLVINENIHHARFLNKAIDIRRSNGVIIERLDAILRRGREQGLFRHDIDAIEVHMVISALCVFRIGNGHTFRALFARDIACPSIHNHMKSIICDTVLRFLAT